MIANILFIFICFSLFLNEAGRIALGNNIAITILDISVFIFLCYTFIFSERKKVIKSNDLFIVPFFIFISIAVLSLFFNILRYSVQHEFVASLYLIRFVMYSLVYKAVRIQFSQNKRFILASLVSTGLFMLVAGILQYLFYSNLRNLYYLGWDNHLYRLFSTFFDPNFAGAFMVLLFLFFCTLFIQTRRKHLEKLSVFFGALLVGALIETFLSFSRSALGMLVVGSFVYFFFLKKIRYFALTIAAIICIYILVSPNASVENTDFLRTASSFARLNSVQTVTQIIIKNPILGVGFDAYRYAQVEYGYRSSVGAQTSHADAGTDNSFLFVFATTGIFGFISYLFLQFKILKTLSSEFQKKKNLFSILLLSSCIGLYFDSFFINSLFYPSILLWVMVLLGIRDYM